MNVWRSINGMLNVELTSAKPEWLLSCLNDAAVELYHLQWLDDLTCRAEISRQDFFVARRICAQTGGKIRIVKKSGIYWTGKRMLRRPVLLGGLALFLAASLYVPTRVLFVKVEGNTLIPSKLILSAAEQCGIRFGASRRAVRSERIKNELLSAVPQLQWAGVNTSGCVATISVRERAEEQAPPQEKTVRSIVAARDGFVLSATALRGNLLVQPGQTVRQGQILISGYTDCGICIRAEAAEGEIFAQTDRSLEAVTPVKYTKQSPIDRELKKYSLIIGKKRIKLWKDSGISVGSCGRMYEENYIVLPGGFRLPVAVCVEVFLPYHMGAESMTREEAHTKLSAFAKSCLAKQMVAGQILHFSGMTAQRGDVFYLNARCICREMIGMVRPEGIGVTNGKDN